MQLCRLHRSDRCVCMCMCVFVSVCVCVCHCEHYAMLYCVTLFTQFQMVSGAFWCFCTFYLKPQAILCFMWNILYLTLYIRIYVHLHEQYQHKPVLVRVLSEGESEDVF